MWKSSERTAVGEVLRAESGFDIETCEDHLGVALIRPGGSRYE